ncbi:hypothetical protein A33M_1489 [Rhodovulum sp. PH10]|nr:hypothetical protein A33M_1489 [Rhodovulum sp. PH10]
MSAAGVARRSRRAARPRKPFIRGRVLIGIRRARVNVTPVSGAREAASQGRRSRPGRGRVVASHGRGMAGGTVGWQSAGGTPPSGGPAPPRARREGATRRAEKPGTAAAGRPWGPPIALRNAENPPKVRSASLCQHRVSAPSCIPVVRPGGPTRWSAPVLGARRRRASERSTARGRRAAERSERGANAAPRGKRTARRRGAARDERVGSGFGDAVFAARGRHG